MKKILFLLPFIMAPARAELTKCVYLNPEMNCTAGRALNTYNGKANWDATCTDSFGTTEITGTWGCGGGAVGNQGGAATWVSVGWGIDVNKDCWCKMLTPAVSKWVYHSRVSLDDSCQYTCGRLCLEALQATGATAFKTGMFNNLGA